QVNIVHRHDWNLNPEQAIALQNEMAKEIVYDRPLDIPNIRLVAGVDVSVKNNVSQAAVVVLSFPDLLPVETVRWQMPTPFPYIPGLLSFREGPVLEEAFRRLQHTPDVFIFDGMGRIHPRRIGIASQMGLWLQKPTIGCGKTHLIGVAAELSDVRGATSDLKDRGEVIGVLLRTRPHVKPVYISVGHLADLPSAIQVTMACTTKYRLPEPIRMAHQAAGQFPESVI
ncbi:MAG TPA: endonuclease V, partial [Aggregatilineales bacterium]|nr:endonuclease V [Aggregatilineales bacterium]